MPVAIATTFGHAPFERGQADQPIQRTTVEQVPAERVSNLASDCALAGTDRSIDRYYRRFRSLIA